MTRRVELVPGPSLWVLWRVFRIVTSSLVVTGGVAGILVVIVGRDRPELLIFPICVASALGLATVALILWVLRRRDIEARSGYTTTPHPFVNLATVDFRTGEVMREPGEPLLTHQEFMRRLKQPIVGPA